QLLLRRGWRRHVLRRQALHARDRARLHSDRARLAGAPRCAPRHPHRRPSARRDERLPRVVEALRATSTDCGGEVRFATRVTDIALAGGVATGMVTAAGGACRRTRCDSRGRAFGPPRVRAPPAPRPCTRAEAVRGRCPRRASPSPRRPDPVSLYET